MILTCPECSTRFKIADDAIGPNGRTVRCSQCSATWFVAAEPDVLALDEAKKVTEMREEAIREPVSDIGTDTDIAAESAEETLAGVGAHAAIRENTDRKRARRRLFGVSMIWIVTLAILALFALAAYLFRAPIVKKFPGTAPVYKAFGWEASASGLEIYELKRKFVTNEGAPALVVNGKIKNYDVKTRDVNMIRFDFKNAAGEVLASWVVEPSKSVLEAGEVLSFVSQYPNPPIDAEKLGWQFVGEADPQSATNMASQ